MYGNLKIKESSAHGFQKMGSTGSLVAWGAGETLYRILDEYKDFRFEDVIDYIVDSSPCKWNTAVRYGNRSIEVKPPAFLCENSDRNTNLMIASVYVEEILKTLQKLEFKGSIYGIPEFQFDYMIEEKLRAKSYPIRDDTIVFHSDSDYTDNARVLFDYMIRNGLNKKYKLAWGVSCPEEFSYLTEYENVDVFCCDSYTLEGKDDTAVYNRYRYTSKWFFLSHDLDWMYDKRPEQIVFNLWHGCGYKKRKNRAFDFEEKFDYNCVTGPLYRSIQSDYFHCPEEKILVLGHPKTDLFFETDAVKIKERLKLASYSKVIAWLPTFRETLNSNLAERTKENETGIPGVDTFDQLDTLNQFLSSRNAVMVIKAHQYQDFRKYTQRVYSNIYLWENRYLIENKIQVNEFLACADALLTDYSSAAVDYLATDRMMGFPIDDIEEFSQGREFLVEPLEDYLPGYIIRSFDELRAFVNDVTEGNDRSKEKRAALRPQMMQYRDGESCKRILEFLQIG